MGASRTRHSLRPLLRGCCWQSSDAFAPRDRGGVYFYAARPLRANGSTPLCPAVIASAAKQSSFVSCGTMDCFDGARNDGAIGGVALTNKHLWLWVPACAGTTIVERFPQPKNKSENHRGRP